MGIQLATFVPLFHISTVLRGRQSDLESSDGDVYQKRKISFPKSPK